MGIDFKVEIIHRETITPSSPTPSHLRNVSLSFLDQYYPEVYIPLVLFYTNDADHHVSISSLEKSSLLKASLSETLGKFYPFAGEFQHNDSIRCDDRGAAFIEARVDCRISKILESPDIEKLTCLFPTSVESSQELTGHLLLVQVNLFECGGMAIAINISHKLGDAFTFSTFLKSWSDVALGSFSTNDHVEFSIAASLHPPRDFLNKPKPHIEAIEAFQREKCVTKRFVFDASQIDALKSKAFSASAPNPTRVEVVSALIWKCATKASRSRLGCVQPSIWCQGVNMRKRSSHAITKNLLGNFVWNFKAITLESEVDVQSLVATLRKSIEDYKVKCPNGVSNEDMFQAIKESENNLEREGKDFYDCSSWCRLPFYETNFGWGKPYWVSVCSFQYKNMVILMDEKDGYGVEAFLTFLKEDMAIVECNQEMLAYASLNPSVI